MQTETSEKNQEMLTTKELDIKLNSAEVMGGQTLIAKVHATKDII